jgi:hypothetical protein
MDPLLTLLRRLNEHGVRYAIVGGFAANAHGSPMTTNDLDVCAPMDAENLARICDALRDLHPYFRMRPDRLPLYEDPARLIGFKNLNLGTDFGVIDVLGELSGVGVFDDLAVRFNVAGIECDVIDLETLITAKTAAGRDKDILGVRHLKAIQQRLRDNPDLFDSRKPPD